jgi:putative ABC transport system permease protein
MTWLTIFAGLLTVVAVVSISGAEYGREMAILSALGGTRKVISKIYSLEFAALGALSGVIGATLGWGLSTAVIDVLFHRLDMRFDWIAFSLSILLSVVMTVIAGWLPTYRLLARKPLDVLRYERADSLQVGPSR